MDRDTTRGAPVEVIRGEGGLLHTDREDQEGEPPDERALPAHGILEQGEVGGARDQEGDSGEPFDQERMTPRPAEAPHCRTKRE